MAERSETSTYKVNVAGRRELEDIRPPSSGLLDLDEAGIAREENQILQDKQSHSISTTPALIRSRAEHQLQAKVKTRTSSDSFVLLFFQMKCSRPSSPFWSMMAPLRASGSTNFDVGERRNMRPALNAMRYSAVDIYSPVREVSVETVLWCGRHGGGGTKERSSVDALAGRVCVHPEPRGSLDDLVRVHGGSRWFRRFVLLHRTRIIY